LEKRLVGEPEIKRMTVEAFLDWQLRQDKLYELVDGVPVLPLKMMTGASSNHDRAVVNAISFLRYALRGKPCRPTTDRTAAFAGQMSRSNAATPVRAT
jgi:Uma2 family endonuclease